MEILMNIHSKYLSRIATHVFAIFLLLAIAPEAFSSNRPHDSKQRKAAQTQQRAKGTCDPQTKKIGDVCRSTSATLVLNQSIVVNAGDPPYDCGGGYIVPAALTTSTDPSNDPKRYQAPSSPQVGFFVPDAHNVQIRNCKIIGFDFGIFAVKGKTSAGSTAINNTLADNQIIAHYVGISLLSVDNTEVANNQVTVTHQGGRAINVQWDADRNNLHNNTIIGDFDSARNGAFVAPSTDANGNPVTVASNPLTNSKPQLVFIGQLQGVERPLLTAVVNGAIYQFSITAAPAESDFTEDNVFDSNTLSVNLANTYDGLVVALPRRTVVRNNTVFPNMKSPIRVGTQLGTSPVFPGTCSTNPVRSCLDASECNLAPAAGTCQGAVPQTVSIAWTSINNTIEGNTVYAPFSDMGIGSAGRGTKIIGNVIDVESGKPPVGPVVIGAISLFSESYGDTANPAWGATVTRNTVSNVWPALSLAIRTTLQSPTEGFTAQIGLNDFFTVYKTVNGVRVPNPAVRVLSQPGSTPPEYFIPTDISINFSERVSSSPKPITGNFWGLDCPDRFLSSASTPSSVLVNGSLKSGVVVDDSHAFDDTVMRTITLFEMPSRPPRCPQASSLGN
jgi:hypothetical protein